MFTSLVHEFIFTNCIPPANSVYICHGINTSLDRRRANGQRGWDLISFSVWCPGKKFCICVCILKNSICPLHGKLFALYSDTAGYSSGNALSHWWYLMCFSKLELPLAMQDSLCVCELAQLQEAVPPGCLWDCMGGRQWFPAPELFSCFPLLIPMHTNGVLKQIQWWILLFSQKSLPIKSWFLLDVSGGGETLEAQPCSDGLAESRCAECKFRSLRFIVREDILSAQCHFNLFLVFRALIASPCHRLCWGLVSKDVEA